jgi:hypothetical protein
MTGLGVVAKPEQYVKDLSRKIVIRGCSEAVRQHSLWTRNLRHSLHFIFSRGLSSPGSRQLAPARVVRIDLGDGTLHLGLNESSSTVTVVPLQGIRYQREIRRYWL